MGQRAAPQERREEKVGYARSREDTKRSHLAEGRYHRAAVALMKNDERKDGCAARHNSFVSSRLRARQFSLCLFAAARILQGRRPC